MPSSNVSFPELMRIAANAAQLCMDDPNCIVDFLGDGVEPNGDGTYTVNLAGAVLVKVFGEGRDKRFGTQGEPPWQAALHEVSRGNVSTALERAFGKNEKIAPSEAIDQITSNYELIDRNPDNTDSKIAWTKHVAKVLETLSEWKCASETIEFRDYKNRLRTRVTKVSKPFLKICQEIANTVDAEHGLVRETEWGDVDFSDVNDVILRVRRLSDQLIDVRDDGISSAEAEKTLAALESVRDVLSRMREWDLTKEDAANERTALMKELKEEETELREIVQDWFPLWTTLETERRRTAAEETEQRALHAQAEATGEATNTIRDAYNKEADHDKISKFRWTTLAFSCVVGIILINLFLWNLNGGDGGKPWSPERIDKIVLRVLLSSVLGGIAIWAGRIATTKLAHETDHRHKAVIAQTLSGMKEGLDSEESREQLSLLAYSRLMESMDPRRAQAGGPISADPGRLVLERLAKMVHSEAKP